MRIRMTEPPHMGRHPKIRRSFYQHSPPRHRRPSPLRLEFLPRLLKRLGPLDTLGKKDHSDSAAVPDGPQRDRPDRRYPMRLQLQQQSPLTLSRVQPEHPLNPGSKAQRRIEEHLCEHGLVAHLDPPDAPMLARLDQTSSWVCFKPIPSRCAAIKE